MATLLAMPIDRRREIGNRLRDRARSLYSWERAGALLENIYHQLREQRGVRLR
jgi:glycosyltransferase involved in cell wall biosynthesis